MNRDQMAMHTLAWVWGVCILWNQTANQFSTTDGASFQDFVHRTHTTVWNYLFNNLVLNGSCSDFECNTALEARELFASKLTNV